MFSFISSEVFNASIYKDAISPVSFITRDTRSIKTLNSLMLLWVAVGSISWKSLLKCDQYYFDMQIQI